MATKPVPKPRRRKVCASTCEDAVKTPAPPVIQGRDFIEPAQPGEHLDHKVMAIKLPVPKPRRQKVCGTAEDTGKIAPQPGDYILRHQADFKQESDTETSDEEESDSEESDSPEQHALRYYEKELITDLLKNAPHSLLTLTRKAHGRGLISGEVRKQLESLDNSVPHHLMCRYLLLHVHKSMDVQDKFEHLLELLSTVEVASGVLSLVRQYYASLTNKDLPVSEEVFLIFGFHVPALTEILAGHSSKWKEIATALWLTSNKIENIIAMNCKPILSLKEVLLSWVVGECKHSKPPTLQNLKEALCSQTVGLGNIANTLNIDKFVVSEGKSTSKIEDIGGDIQVINNYNDDCVNVTESSCVLLGIQVSGNHKVKYQWSKKEKHSGNFEKFKESNENILYIFVEDLTLEGYYRCSVPCDKREFIYSEPILLAVHTPLDQYQGILISKYTMSPDVPEDTWPPVNTNSYINLALIKQENIHKAGQYGRCTIRGDMDDIYKDKESITYDKALGCLSSGAYLLIEGRPGSGKTTLIHKFCQNWARKEITMTHVRLLFLIHLRGFCSKPNIGLCDLIGCYFSGSDVEVIEKYANEHQGLGLCFVLDGLDEYMPQKKDAYIYELIRKSVLPKSVVIVASRPAAAADFRKGTTMQIEVLGFLSDEIYDYIENYTFSSPSKSHTGLIQYLDEHPNVLHMCYLPIHACMVCFLYDNLESDLPQTETSIYAEFTKFTMLRMLYRDDSNTDMCIESLNDLPEPHNQLYDSICKLAFEMTKTSKQVMTQTEVKHFFHLQPTDKDCMGLITVDKMAMMCGFQNLYTFLHLTFQEFLSAFYIISLDEENQLELIEQFESSTQMKQVWKFYCGLTPFNSPVIRLINKSCHGTPFKVQCSFESQQPHTCDSVVDKNSLVFKKHFFTSSDFTAIAYVISNAQHQCVMKVVFDKCTVGMEGVQILRQKAGNKLSHIRTFCYHGYDCVTEQLYVVNRLMHSLPCLEILDVSNTNLGPARVDALTGSLNHPNLQIMKVGSPGNPLYLSQDLQLLLAERFSSGCSKLVNVCFSGNDRACYPLSLPFPFYFYSSIPVLKLCFCKLRPIELHVLSDDLMHSCNCIELYLTMCSIDDNAVSILSDGLKHCTNLKILDLSCNRIGDKGAVSLAEGIQLAQTLGKLNLSLNRIGDVGAMAVANATKCLVYLCCNSITNTNDILKHAVSGHNVDFHTLTFSGCDIGDSDAESLLHFLEKSSLIDPKAPLSTKTVQCYSSVHILDISSNYMSFHGAVALSSCLKYFPHLEELHINNDGVGALDAIANVLSGNLHKLKISNNSISCSGAKSIADALKHCTHLEELNINDNRIGEDGACVLASSLYNLKESLLKLDISNNSIKSGCVNVIADVLKQYKHLTELNISGNYIGEDGACVLASSLCNLKESLLKLDISNNSIKSGGVKAIANALKQCKHLGELNISGNYIGEDGACVLASSLCNFKKSLHKLDISNNGIKSGGVNAFANALKQCKHLTELNISGNCIGDVGLSGLASTFRHCAGRLCKLDVSSNNIRIDGAKAIANVLKRCTHLEELVVSHNSIGDEGACIIASSLGHCAQSLHKLCMSDNDIGTKGCEAIAKALKHYKKLKELDLSSNNLE